MVRALIIEAEEQSASQIAQVAKAHGLSPLVISHGPTALTEAKVHPPELIVISAELPNMSGYALCAKFKKHQPLQHIPLILTSSNATLETFEHHKKLKTRADGYLMKPFEDRSLRKLIEAHVLPRLRQPRDLANALQAPVTPRQPPSPLAPPPSSSSIPSSVPKRSVPTKMERPSHPDNPSQAKKPAFSSHAADVPTHEVDIADAFQSIDVPNSPVLPHTSALPSNHSDRPSYADDLLVPNTPAPSSLPASLPIPAPVHEGPDGIDQLKSELARCGRMMLNFERRMLSAERKVDTLTREKMQLEQRIAQLEAILLR